MMMRSTLYKTKTHSWTFYSAAFFVDHVIEVSQLYWAFLFMLPLILPAVGLVLIIQKERAKTAEFAYSYNTRSKSE
jgi:hypothetical protein